MKSRHYAGLLGVAIAVASGSLAVAGSTATITQGDGDGSVIRRVFRSQDGQTIFRQQGGNRAFITQGSSRDHARDERVLDEAGMEMLVRLAPADREALLELAMDEGTSVEALVEEAIRDFLDRNR